MNCPSFQRRFLNKSFLKRRLRMLQIPYFVVKPFTLKTHILIVIALISAGAITAQNDTIPAKEEITTYQKETALAYRNAGNLFFTDGLYYEAIEEYTKAIAENPYDRLAWYNRAVSHYRLENLNAAIHDLTRILKLEDGFVAAYFLRGTYYFEMEDLRKSRTDFSSILSIRPNDALSYRKRGTVRYLMKDQHGALKDYDQSIILNSKDPIAFHDRAVVREYLGDKKGAKADKQMVKELEK
jgi:tetratricopeptide (TPR) repeat protein